MKRKVEANKIVELSYELREEDHRGVLLEKMDIHYPLQFLFGSGLMLKAFEENLFGLSEGQRFSFALNPEEAYGTMIPDLFVEISSAVYKDDPWFNIETVSKGDRIVVKNPDSNKEEIGTIIEILSESILVDFNHALAGKTLHFSGEILLVRNPNAQEKEKNRISGEISSSQKPQSKRNK